MELYLPLDNCNSVSPGLDNPWLLNEGMLQLCPNLNEFEYSLHYSRIRYIKGTAQKVWLVLNNQSIRCICHIISQVSMVDVSQTLGKSLYADNADIDGWENMHLYTKCVVCICMQNHIPSGC